MKKSLFFSALVASTCFLNPLGAIVTLHVGLSSDTLPVGNFGELRNALNTVNNSALNTFQIVFQIPSGSPTITLNGMLPLMNAESANILGIDGTNSGGGFVTIDGASTYPGFFAKQGAITIQNMTIQNVVANGGSGGSGTSHGVSLGGGGGALGAGAAVFIDNANVTLTNVTFSNCIATGGNGSFGTNQSTGGGGGGMFGGTGGISIVSTGAGVVGGAGGGGGLGGIGGNGGNVSDTHSTGGGGGGGTAAGGATTALGGNGGGATTLATSGGTGNLQGAATAGSGALDTFGTGGTLAGGGGGGGNTAAGGGGGGGGDPPSLGFSDASGQNGGKGGYGGGGGGAAIGTANGNGGLGGFGGGGGGGSLDAGNGSFGGGGGAAPTLGGTGGFGGGGGAGLSSVSSTAGSGGIGAGNGGVNGGSGATGGGGAGLGGAIFVNTGTLIISGTAQTTGNAVNAGTGQFNGGFVATDLFAISSANPLTFTPGAAMTITMSGTIGDDSHNSLPGGTYTAGIGTGSSLLMNGSGTLELGGSNTYSGGTTIGSTGTIKVDNNNSLGNPASSLTFTASGTLQAGGALTIPNPITLTSSGTVDSLTNNVTLSGAITGAGGLTKIGTGTINLTNTSNTYSGGTLITNGQIVASTQTLPVAGSGTSVTLSSATSTLNFLNTTPGIYTGSIFLNSVGSQLISSGLTTTTLTGQISGTGLVNIENGTLVLTSTSPANNYSGGTTVFSGAELDVISGALPVGTTNPSVQDNGTLKFIDSSTGSFSGNINLGNISAQVVMAGTGAVTLSGAITGSGKLVVNNGLLSLTNNGNNYTTGTTINNGAELDVISTALPAGLPNPSVFISQGTLKFLDSSPGSFSGIIEFASTNAEVAMNGTSTVTLSGQISGNGFLSVNSGTLVLSGTPNIYTGTTFINAGTLQAGGINRLSANSNVVIAPGATLNLNNNDNTIGSLSGGGGTVSVGTASFTFGNSQSTTFAGSFTGSNSGQITVQGSGTFNLTGPGNSSGFTGTLNIFNSFALNQIFGGNVFVDAGGTLSGTGTILQNLTVDAGSTIMPGNNSIGTMTVGGNYEQDPGSTYIVQFCGIQSSLINITGTALINGGQVVAVPLCLPPSQTPYLILHAASGRNGHFDGVTLSQPIEGFTPSLVYPNGNDVFLVFAEEPGKAFIIPASTCNQKTIAAQFNAIVLPNPDQLLILETLTALSAEDAQHALNQMSGEQYTMLLATTELTGQQFLRRLYDPLRSIVTTEPCCDPCCCYACPTLDAWIEASGGQTFLDGNVNCRGLKANGYEITGGVQSTFGCDWTLGSAISYAHDHVQYRVGGKGNNRTTIGAVYGLYRPQGFYVLGDIAFGYTHDRVKRPIHIGPVSYYSKSCPKIFQGIAYAEVGLDICPCDSCVLFQPFGGIQVGTLNRKSFTENCDSFLSLDVRSKSRTNCFTRLGVHMTTIATQCWNVSLDLAWQYRLSNPDNNFTADFNSFGTPFEIFGNPIGRNSFDGALTLTADVWENWQFYIETSGQVWNKASSYNILGGVKYSW